MELYITNYKYYALSDLVAASPAGMDWGLSRQNDAHPVTPQKKSGCPHQFRPRPATAIASANSGILRSVGLVYYTGPV